MMTICCAAARLLRARARLAVLIGLGPLLAGALPGHAQPMLMQGDHKVTSSGSFEYVVPIAVAPGVAGRIPAVSLVFNSASGNGAVGVGWNLNATSSIQLCAKTMAQDGERGAQTYGSEARFCLDGQRLMLVSGTYGQPGSEYRTEMESFRRVRYYAPNGAVSSYFLVEDPDGDRSEYGGTADTSVALDGVQPPAVVQWWKRKESDAVGNSITYTYERDAAARGLGAQYLRKIAYGGNAAKGLADSAWVNFEYEQRPDRQAGYRAGYETYAFRRLKSIQTSSGSSVLHNYTLDYETGPTTAKSRLKRISQCAADGACLPPTVMSFEAETGPMVNVNDVYLEPNGVAYDAAGSLFMSKTVIGDVDGDGRSDLIQLVSGGTLYTWIADSGQPSGYRVVKFQFTPVRNQSLIHDADWPVYVGDFNGDGRADVFRALPNKIGQSAPTYPTEWLFYLSKGDGTYEVKSYLPGTGPTLETVITLMDIDGDGRMDIISKNSSSGRNVHRLQTDGSITQTALPAASGEVVSAFDAALMDANGDGLVDSLVASGSSLITNISKGGGVYVPSTPTPMTWGLPLDNWNLGDFNSDGIPDVLVRNVSYPDRFGGPVVTLQPYYGRGDGTYTPGPVTSKTVAKTMAQSITWLPADVNGDGRPDLISVFHNSYDDGGQVMDQGGIYFWLSRADGGFDLVSGDAAQNQRVMDDGGFFFPMDDLGRGAPDLVSVGMKRTAWRLAPQRRDLPVAISTAPQRSVTWKSSTLSQSRGISYFQDKPNAKPGETTGYQWPKVAVSPPTPVTTETLELQGSVKLATNYSYGTLIVDKSVNGRGSAGFAWTQNEVSMLRAGESLPTLTSRQVFSQEFPFIGMTVMQGSGRNGRWNELLQTDVSYGCLMPNEPSGTGMSECSDFPQPGRRFHTYTKTSRTKNFDPSGALLGDKLTEVLALDAYGNVSSSRESLFAAGASTARYVSLTDNVYSNDLAKWQLRKVVRSTVTRGNGSADDGGGGVPPGDGGGGQPPAGSPAVLQSILMLLLED